MLNDVNRRSFMKLVGLSGVVFASGLPGRALAGESGHALAATEDFYFLQLSDTHWGFAGAPNPDAAITLPKTIETVNSLSIKPDFIIFTGDLTQTTPDVTERRRRMLEFKDLAQRLAVKDIRYIPGEHDAGLDLGAAYREIFGPSYYSFDHKGVHFIALDNVSDPGSRLGALQLDWLRQDLASRNPQDQIVVFAHRPLFDLYPAWDWATADGDQALALLANYAHVTVFYGHIHQENHHMTGAIAHHSAKSLIFPLPAPGAAPKRTPLPWNPAEPYAGLGFRSIEALPGKPDYGLIEYPVIPKV